MILHLPDLPAKIHFYLITDVNTNHIEMDAENKKQLLSKAEINIKVLGKK